MYWFHILNQCWVLKNSWHRSKFKPPHLDIKPLAICDFDDGEACGWINEESDLKRQWIINQGSLCLKAKHYPAKLLHSKASWIPGIASETREVESDVTARFKSPSVPPSIGLKCIGFAYSVDLGKSSETVDSSASLALLQQQKGYENIVPSTLLFLFSLSPLESLESSRPTPLAVCDFDDGDTCGWVHEEAVWTHQWSVQAQSLCVKAKSILPQKKKSSSWFADRSVDKLLDSSKEVSVRFTSPPIPGVVNLKCIAFIYSMDLGHGKASESMGSLSLLQQQKGCLFHLPSPLYVWTFDEGDMEEWTNDIDNWQQKWRTMETNLPSSSICISAKLPRKSSSKKLSLVSTLVAKKSSSRFWSPSISGRLGIKCFSLQFIIESAGSGANLALLRQSSGTSAEALQNKWNFGEFLDESNNSNFGNPPIPQDSGLRCVTLKFKIMEGSDVSHASSFVLLQRQDELFPEPYYIWRFDESLEDWANDVTNWDLKWELIDGSVCLQNVPFKPKIPSKRRPWVNSKAKKVKTAKVTKASFWSPPLPQDSGMRCLTMEYRISQGSEMSQIFSLAMLLQQDGFSSFNSLFDNKHIDVKVSLDRYFSSISHIVSRFVPLDAPPNPYFVWTFDKSMGDWKNDAANWLQMWELISGAICLRNTPTKPEEPSESVPWLVSKKKKEEKLTKASKVPLWSPPIPQDIGLRCITVDYQISGKTTASQIYNGLPSPYFVWTFDDSMGEWSNDAANFLQKWGLLDGSICLKNVQIKPKKTSQSLPWLVSKKKKEEVVAKNSKALLWSPPIPQDIGMRCITMDYKIHGESLRAESILQQQDGKWANDLLNWNQKWEPTDRAICFKDVIAGPETAENDMSWIAMKPVIEIKKSTNHKAPPWSPTISEVARMHCIRIQINLKPTVWLYCNSKKEVLLKPIYVWTFNENMGKWINDISNWNQKWELADGAICLKNIPTEPETAEDDFSWLSVNPKLEQETPKLAKTQLWSPPIRKTIGMRCITIDYRIHVHPNDSEIYSLAVLQQQDGLTCKTLLRVDIQREHGKVGQPPIQLESKMLYGNHSTYGPLTKTFGKWANDLSNWNQKWKFMNDAICLENVQADPQAGINDLPRFCYKA
ncbi:hypothetical protein ACTXT7_002649 [Hymenolepis weldensis]